jgi:hypothetical protein
MRREHHHHGYGLEVRVSNTGRDKRFSRLHNHLYELWCLPSLLSSVYWGSSLGVKQLGHEADHSLPSLADVKMSGAVPVLLLYAFMARTGTM